MLRPYTTRLKRHRVLARQRCYARLRGERSKATLPYGARRYQEKKGGARRDVGRPGGPRGEASETTDAGATTSAIGGARTSSGAGVRASTNAATTGTDAVGCSGRPGVTLRSQQPGAVSSRRARPSGPRECLTAQQASAAGNASEATSIGAMDCPVNWHTSTEAA